ncbi:MAG: hypothetical protein QE285_17275 [Aquabacterium sp.]|nr:hypothetical protein [Aquabacterium sp.]
MNAVALALSTTQPAAKLPAPAAPAVALPLAPVAGLSLQDANGIAQTAELLRLACRRGQLEDASAAARITLPLAQPHSPHAAMLQALASAQPALMMPPEERRLYMLRSADGQSQGVIRLRDNGRTGLNPPAGAERWQLRDGNLELCDASGQASTRFMLCGNRNGLRLYLGVCADSGQPCLLEEQRCTYTRLSLLDPELVDPFCSLYSADAMVPAALPAGAALLLGAPHTRADQLARTLNRSTGVLIDGDLLHPQGMQLADRLLSRPAARTLQALRAKDPAWFVRMMLSRSHDASGRSLGSLPVRGFTMAPAHNPAALDWALAEPNLRIVHVMRSNLLAEFADLLAEQHAPGDQALRFEPERFGRFIEMKQRQLDALRARLRQRNADTVEVDGSRLNQATVAELLQFLTDGANPHGMACEAVACGPRQVIDRFDNPDAVLPCLRAINRAGWAEAEGQVVDPD